MEDQANGSKKTKLSDTELKATESYLTGIREERRRRPLYFDGRFLAARDLTREQDYFLARQADLGRAGGFGVVDGFLVSGAGSSLSVEPGHGVTPSGELVVLSRALKFDLDKVVDTNTIRVRLGIASAVWSPGGSRTGLYVLALRPVEYEANPIAQYPTSLGGERSVHNGDIIEATAATLIPYPDLGEPTELKDRRAHAAKEIFVEHVRAGSVADALPIAMVAIDRNKILWVDSHLVRREIGASGGDILGVSGVPLALREAHMLQFAEHLKKVAAAHGGIVASQHFLVLPPAGPMPTASIDVQSLTQRFFPAEVDVDLSIIPRDELAALLEEARLLPPLDLGDPEEMKSTSVLVLVPVDRAEFDTVRLSLGGARRKLPPVAPNLFARKRPLERLNALPLLRQGTQQPKPGTQSEGPWQKVLNNASAEKFVWYVRRRNLSIKPEIAPQLSDDAFELARRLKGYGIEERDVRHVEPGRWRVHRSKVMDLASSWPLLAAAVVIALGQKPSSPEDTNQDQSWDNFVKVEHNELNATFAEHLPETIELIRLGVFFEFAAGFDKLMNNQSDWRSKLRSLSNKLEGAVRSRALRGMLLGGMLLAQSSAETKNPVHKGPT